MGISMVSQRRYSRDEPVPTGEEEWQIVSTKWWCTPFSSVSWSYDPEKAPRNVIFSKPPHYQLSLHNEQVQRFFDDQGCGPEFSHSLHEWSSAFKVTDDTVLNEELIGVKSACEVLKAYEEAVGFDYSPWPNLHLKDLEKGEKRIIDVSEMEVQLGKELWTELVNGLIGGKSLKEILKEVRDNTKDTLQRTFAIPNKINYFSRPSMPKPFQFNPSASSFVPLGSPTSTFSSSSCSSSSLNSPDPLGPSSFPSLTTPLSSPANKHRRDLQEYINGVHTRCRTTSSDGSFAASFERSSSEFLPSFLFDSADHRRRPTRASRTRTIVDRLRSQLQHDEDRTSPVSQVPSPTVSDFGVGGLGYFKPRLTISDGSSAYSITPPLTEEDSHHHDRGGIGSWTDNTEGWALSPVPAVVDQETKRTRSKELLMTLRRRTDSLTSNTNAIVNSAVGAMSASTSPALIASERLVESPEPVEAVDSHEEELSERTNQSHQIANFRVSSPLLGDRRASAQSTSPEVNYIHMLSQDRAMTRNLSPVYSRTHPKTDSSTRCSRRYIMNPDSGLSYPLFGRPLPIPNMGVPVQVSTMGTPRTGMRFPVQMPIQVPVRTMQYSTLMHLRIMQQMQIMRNSMNMAPISGTNTQSGSTR